MRQRPGHRVAALLITFAVCASSPARADDDERAPIYAVQNREYPQGAEFHAGIGVLPMNAFTKGFTIGGGITWHLSQVWAWEIAQFVYSFPVDTGLKEQLLTNFMVQPTQIPVLQYFGSSSLLLKPFYGKVAAFNRTVIHLEIFLAAGGALAHYIQPSTFQFGFDAGAGMRFYFGRHFSLRLDVRDYAIFYKGVQNELYISLGVGLSVGGGG